MALSAVTFVLGTGQIGQAAAGNDYISGLCLYGTAPGTFAVSPYQAIYSYAGAATAGITLDYADETQAKAIYTISGTVTLGDTFAISVAEPNPVTSANPTGATVVGLGTVTVATAATPTGAATDFAAKVNAGTYSHGYSATSAAGVVTLTARTGTGNSLNTGTPLAVTVTGTSTGAITQQFGTGSGGATAGVYSKKALWNYQIWQFFQANPSGVLWVGVFSAVSGTFADVMTLQNAAGGSCKQIGVLDPTVTSASAFQSNMTLLQAQAVLGFNGYNPFVIHYAPNVAAVSASALVNNQTTGLNDYYVTPVILQDGGAAGAQLYINSGVSVPGLGCSLGTTSAAAVNQDIGEIGAFNIASGVFSLGTLQNNTATEFATPALTTGGALISAQATTLLTQLDSYRYVFAMPQPNMIGTFFNNDWSAIVQTSPYYRQSRNRVMNKAVRLIYANIAPLLKSRITLNTDGTINIVTLNAFNGAVIPVGTQMKNAGEISNLRVTINPSQNIISAGKLVLGVAIQPTLIADFIECDMSFVAKI